MQAICAEELCSDAYGRKRIHRALLLRQPEGVTIPSESTVYRVKKEIGLVHRPKHKPNGITTADREARKSDDLLKRDFSSDHPLEKYVTDITELKAKDGKLYVSAIFDSFDLTVLGLTMDDNMRVELCVRTLYNALTAYPVLRGAVVHSDRGPRHTSGACRAAVERYAIRQSMNSYGGRCHGNARCESMWARMKSELFYDRIDPERLTLEELKSLVWARQKILCKSRQAAVKKTGANQGLARAGHSLA